MRFIVVLVLSTLAACSTSAYACKFGKYNPSGGGSNCGNEDGGASAREQERIRQIREENERVERLRTNEHLNQPAPYSSTIAEPDPAPAMPPPAIAPTPLAGNDLENDERLYCERFPSGSDAMAECYGEMNERAENKEKECHKLLGANDPNVAGCFDLAAQFYTEGMFHAAYDLKMEMRQLATKVRAKRGAVERGRDVPFNTDVGTISDACITLGRPKLVSSMCDFTDGRGLYYTPVRLKETLGCPREAEIEYVDPDTNEIRSYFVTRRGTVIDSCVAGVALVRMSAK